MARAAPPLHPPPIHLEGGPDEENPPQKNKEIHEHEPIQGDGDHGVMGELTAVCGSEDISIQTILSPAPAVPRARRMRADRSASARGLPLVRTMKTSRAVPSSVILARKTEGRASGDSIGAESTGGSLPAERAVSTIPITGRRATGAADFEIVVGTGRDISASAPTKRAEVVPEGACMKSGATRSKDGVWEDGASIGGRPESSRPGASSEGSSARSHTGSPGDKLPRSPVRKTSAAWTAGGRPAG